MMRRCIAQISRKRQPHCRFLTAGSCSQITTRAFTYNQGNKHYDGRQNSRRYWLLAAGLAGIGAGCAVYSQSHNEYDWTAGLKTLLPVVHAASLVGPGGDIPNQDSRQNEYNFITDVVERVSPAVVDIKGWCRDCSKFCKRRGSGFIVSQDGLIVTNAHVIQFSSSANVEVELINGKKYNGTTLVVDSASDLALVKIEAENLPILKLGSSASLRPGEWVVNVGSPHSLSNTVTSGIVSSTGRRSRELGLSNDIDYILTDVPSAFGSSGGPLINLDGAAVGVHSMSKDGISFAIPSDYVQKFLIRADEFKQKSEMERLGRDSFIGITSLSLNPQLAAQLYALTKLSQLELSNGVVVTGVMPGSPAYEAGIEKADVITNINGKNIKCNDDLLAAVRGKSEVRFTVHRSGDAKEITVKQIIH